MGSSCGKCISVPFTRSIYPMDEDCDEGSIRNEKNDEIAVGSLVKSNVWSSSGGDHETNYVIKHAHGNSRVYIVPKSSQGRWRHFTLYSHNFKHLSMNFFSLTSRVIVERLEIWSSFLPHDLFFAPYLFRSAYVYIYIESATKSRFTTAT